MQKKIWHKVAEEISLQVSLGKWPVGSIIPGEIELAKQFNVSRDTMRKALAYLSQQGLFERKAHVGTRVKARTRTGRFLNEYNDIRGIDHYGISILGTSKTSNVWFSMKKPRIVWV